MTKQKHLETMSAEDREIHAKLTAKMSWVVEYPKDGKNPPPQQPGSNQQPAAGQQIKQTQSLANLNSGGNVQSNASQNVNAQKQILANQMYGPQMQAGFDPYGDEEEEEEEDYDEDEFDEEGLDEEDREKLRQMREAHLAKQAAMGLAGGLGEGGEMGFDDMDYEGEEEEGEGYEDYDEEYEEMDMQQGPGSMGDMGGMMGAPGSRPQGHGGQGGQFMQQLNPEDAHMENFLLMGVMAKCQICNKIVRRTETKMHMDIHEKELVDEEEEGEEGAEFDGYVEENADYDEDSVEGYPSQSGNAYLGHSQGGEGFPSQSGEGYHDQGGIEGEFEARAKGEDDYDEEEGGEEDFGEGGMTFTAEKLSGEMLVAERIPSESEEVAGPGVDNTVCEVCNKRFASSANMRRHKLKLHPEAWGGGGGGGGVVGLGAGTSGTPAEKKFKCPLCEKDFITKGPLTKHLKKVHPDYKSSDILNSSTLSQSSDSNSKLRSLSESQDSKESHSQHSEPNTEVPSQDISNTHSSQSWSHDGSRLSSGQDGSQQPLGGADEALGAGEEGANDGEEAGADSESEPWKCGVCLQEFDTESSLTDHMAATHLNID